jgi:hypothetical protein
MILVPSWSAKGEGRVSRIRKLETMGNIRNLCSYITSAVLTAI